VTSPAIPGTSGGADRAISGIVLAGGRSTRFGSDKLAALVDGRPLLHRSLEALAALCAEVVIVGPHDRPPQAPQAPQAPPALAVPVRLTRDDTPAGGPMVGLAAGLRQAAWPVVIVAAGDMPTPSLGVLRLLVDCVQDGALASGLLEGDRLRPLPCALRRSEALDVALSLGAGVPLRELLRRLDCRGIPESRWRSLDPDGRTLRDVDRPADLEGLGRVEPG